MSVEVITQTIDLTDEPDSPPPRHRRASSESSDVVFVGTYQAPEQQRPVAGSSNPQARPRPLRMTPGASSRDQADHSIMVVGSDDGDELSVEDDHGPPPPPLPAAFRIFSPPAQFSQPIASGSRAARAAPPIHPPPRIGLGGGLVALRDREPPSRYHSQDAARRSGHSPAHRPAPRNIFNRFFETFGSLWGGAGENIEDIRDADYDGYRHQVDLPEFGGMLWDVGGAGGHTARQRAHAHAHARRFYEAVRIDAAAPGWADSETEPVKSTFNHVMTHHREIPGPGFSFDFDPDGTSASAPIVIDEDEPGPSGSSTGKTSSPGTPPPSSTLLCPRCSSTLLLGSRTMWALRCGHVVCETCIQDISFPAQGKGKEEEKSGVAEGVDVDVKGKGKAKAVEEEDVKVDMDNASVTEAALPTPPTKRSRRAVIAPSPSSRQLRSRTVASQEELPIKSIRPVPASRKRGRLTKPGTISEEWEYACPVGDCQRSAYAVKVWEVRDGGAIAGIESGEWVWKQKEGCGAIPIFA